MIGMLGIIVKNNEIRNTIQILQEIKPGEKFLVRFLNPPAFSRVCLVDEVQTWLLFQDQNEADAWVKASSGPPPGGAAQGQISGKQKPPAGNGAANRKDAANPNEPESPEEETEVETPPIVPAKPVTEASLRKALEPDISGGQDPDNNKGDEK